MKLLAYSTGSNLGLAVERDGELLGLTNDHADFPGTVNDIIVGGLERLLQAGETLRAHGKPVDRASVTVLPPCVPGKILCVGLNYADHAAESHLPIPDHPVLFSRFASSLIADGEAIQVPRVSSMLDFEGELAVVIGKRGRYIPEEEALDHVAGYSAFNDGSIRDYQLRTSQWTLGKNFDATGGFGPFLVTPDALPAGAHGLRIQTRLNGEVVQSSSTDQLIFNVARLISIVSEALTLEPGDVIVTGTPAGVGHARDPKLYMKAGDLVEVEIEGIGILRNPIADEKRN